MRYHKPQGRPLVARDICEINDISGRQYPLAFPAGEGGSRSESDEGFLKDRFSFLLFRLWRH